MTRVKRNVGRAGHHDGQHGAQHARRTLHAYADKLTRLYAAGDQVRGQLLGVAGQLGVAPGDAFALKRNALGIMRGAFKKGRGDGLEGRQLKRRLIPAGGEQRVVLTFNQAEIIDAVRGCAERGIKQAGVHAQVALDGGCLEVARVVLKLQARAFFRAVDDGEHHFEDGARAFRAQRDDLHAADVVGQHEGLLVQEENRDLKRVAAV